MVGFVIASCIKCNIYSHNAHVSVPLVSNKPSDTGNGTVLSIGNCIASTSDLLRCSFLSTSMVLFAFWKIRVPIAAADLGTKGQIGPFYII